MEEVAESIKTAWAAVEESGVPEHMQESAFKEALRALLGTTAPAAPRRTVPKPPGVGGGGNGTGSGSGSDGGGDESSAFTVDEDQVMTAVSEETGVPVEKLEAVFHIDDGVVKLNGPGARYGSSTADKARNIALIVTVVRKLGMGQSDTSYEVIKTACDSKHAYDSKNFAPKHMPNVMGCVVKGDNRNRRLEAKGTGITAFSEVIDKVLAAA